MEDHDLISQFEQAKEAALEATKHFNGMAVGTVMTGLAILVAGTLDQVAQRRSPEEAAEMLAAFPGVVMALGMMANEHNNAA